MSSTMDQLLERLHRIRKIDIIVPVNLETSGQPLLLREIPALSNTLSSKNHVREAEALDTVLALAIQSPEFGGLGFQPGQELNPQEEAKVLFLISAWLESINSADRSKQPLKMLDARPKGRRGMTVGEKIFAAHDIERKGEVKPGDMIRVDVDWIMASELTWSGMKVQYDALGKPGIFRNDRFWLAGDHIVDPRIRDTPLVKKFVSESESARDDFALTEYQGNNYTIMHTEFFRERAQPGMLIIGSDSHTCSAGSLGCLAIGLGSADVTMPLITGETWFKVPESVNIRIVGKPSPGIGGKDVILYIMKELKRNTVATDRVVEFSGPGLENLSCDARFAISNMTTEFGGITGLFVPDKVTYKFVNKRKSPRYKRNSNYFLPDEDAVYAEIHTIDISLVEPFIARYPSPDDVVHINEMEGMHLDGCFIGACTTAEEDIILGAMVLELGLNNGLRPTGQGKRKVVPGSLPILHRLKQLGLYEVYEKAGFEVGVPGCSYCVGMSADVAAPGEVWLSSQNRNFENRMGKGSIGNLASAVSVAASSFDMKVTNPKPFLDQLDMDRLKEILGNGLKELIITGPKYVEPNGRGSLKSSDDALASESQSDKSSTNPAGRPASQKTETSDVILGKIQRLGDFIDTDALAPSEALLKCKTTAEFGPYCLVHTHPEFRFRAQNGFNVVVAGVAFGCGSSREGAVSALLGTGIQCVIAKSFAFIYARNQPNLGLLGIVITDEAFYEAAKDGESIEVDLGMRKVKVNGREWTFQISEMELGIIKVGGIEKAFEKFGKGLFEVLCRSGKEVKKGVEGLKGPSELAW